MVTIFYNRFVNVFFAPEKSFKSIIAAPGKWDVLMPIILLMIVGAVSFQAIKPVTLEMSKDYIRNNERLSEEQKEQAFERFEKGSTSVIQMLTTSIGPIITILLSASTFYFLGNFIGGGQSSWLMMLIITSYIQCIDIISSLVKIPLIVSQQSLEVHTSLALLFSEIDYSNWLFKAAAQFDVFRIWKIILWVIAFQLIYKFSRNKSLALIISPFLIGAIFAFFTMGFGK